MPEDLNPEQVPPKVKRFLKWLEDDAATKAFSFMKKALQENPIEFAKDSAIDLFKGEGEQAEILEGLIPVDTDALSRDLAEKIKGIMSSRGVVEFSETMGTLITQPILSILESYAGKEDIDPMEFARSFHGAMILLNMPKAIANLTDITIAGTKMSNIGSSIDAIYWSLGMGFLGWQTLAPLLTSGLQPRLERHYNALYRPKRLVLSDMIYLYLIEDISLSTLNKFIAEEGYPNVLSSSVIKNSFKTPNRGELEEFYSKGQMTSQEVYNAFIRQGYQPKHAAFLRDNVTLNPEDTQKPPAVTKLREALKKGLRTTSEFRDSLEDLGYSKEAVNLEIELINYDRLMDKRELTLGQIKSAYVQGIVTKTEVLFQLRELDYTAEDVNILTLTWDAERKPKILRLNQSNIVAALKAGVISKSQALIRLQQLNYPASEAQVIVDTALATVKSTKLRISLPMLVEARKLNALGQNEFEARLKVEGLDNADIQILTKLATFQPVQTLTSLDVERAFKADVIDTQKAKQLLSETKVQASVIDLRIKTWEEEKGGFKQVFSPATYLLWYRQNVIDKTQLTTKLKESGFTTNDVELFVKSADMVLPDDLSRTEIHDLYVGDVIEKSRAIALLKKTGLETKDINDLIKLWDVEIESDVPEASISAYIAALRNELLTEAEFTKKLKELGYEDELIKFYIKLAQSEEKEKTQKLTKSDILGMYKVELLKKSEALERLTDLGFSQADAELLVKWKTPAEEEEE